jgi:energy-coupling factor transport system permease protein
VRSLDPRAKLMAGVVLAALVIAGQDLPRLSVMAGLISILILIEGLAEHAVRTLRTLAPMLLVTFLLSLPSFGLAAALFVALRFGTLAALFFVYFQTTLPEDLGGSLAQSGVPYPFAFVLQGGMQFVPVMARKARAISDAQRARGLSLERGIRDWSGYLALLAPLLVQAFKTGDELAEAMEARGFGAPRRVFLREYHWRAADFAVVAAALIIGAVLWLY